MLAFYIPKPGMKIWCKKYVQKFELGIFEIFGKPILNTLSLISSIDHDHDFLIQTTFSRNVQL